MRTLWQDLRYGARMLLKQPAFTLIAVLTLSLLISSRPSLGQTAAARLKLEPYSFENVRKEKIEAELGRLRVP